MSDAVVDVRPLIASGGEPLDEILAAAHAVPDGGRLVVLAPFEPMPLYGVMRQMGFSHESELISGGGVRVVFTRNQRT
jgi:hypothetical protein